MTTNINIGINTVTDVTAQELQTEESPISTQPIVSHDVVGRRMNTTLDQLVQIIEISFIFLITFSLITLVDTAFNQLDLYKPLNGYLGEPDVGPLSGGNWKAIVRITLILNLLLFGFSLLFGIWMRRTRDGWTWADLGYVFSTGDYSFKELLRRGTALGLLAILIHFSATTLISVISGLTAAHGVVYFNTAGNIYTPKELNSQYYFGIVEMGFIWPLSAGFFFFAYCHKSLNAKFPTGIANLLSSAFYVFYLQFFFLIDKDTKLSTYYFYMTHPLEEIGFWIMSFALFVILYINFSAFAETGSIVLPFLLNFVYNVGITVIQAGNALFFTEFTSLMFIPVGFVFLMVILWMFRSPRDYDTIKTGTGRLRDVGKVQPLILMGYVALFVFLSFFIPALETEILQQSPKSIIHVDTWVIPILYAANLVLLIVMAVAVLTYEPSEVWDVLLVSKDGVPIASHIEVFETDEVLISGFFTALQAVDQELSRDGGLRSIKRGEREILIEQGVMTQIIALADRDQSTIRNSISKLHREFEISNQKQLEASSAIMDFPEADDLVKKIGDLAITFDIPTQTRWITIISLSLAPIMIALVGLILI